MAALTGMFFLFMTYFLCAAPPALALDAYVVNIEDGGVVLVSESKNPDAPVEKYFFYGVEVPTAQQPFGEEALLWLRDKLPQGCEVTLKSISKGSDGTPRALIQSGGISVNYQLLYDGFAWVDRAQCKAIFCRRWYIQEHKAVVEKRGLWSVPMPTPPWQWGR